MPSKAPATLSWDEANGSADQGQSNGEVLPPDPAQASWLKRAGNFASDAASGLGESAIGLMSTGDEWARHHLPAFFTNSNFGFGKPADLQHVHDLATPQNTTQAVFKGAGDAAQFLIPGEAEEAAAKGLTSVAPKIVRPFIAPAARVGASAVGSGAVNAAQGHDFKSGAEAGLLGGTAAEGLRAMAAPVAESALKVRGNQRLFGRTVGDAIINDTYGIRPETVGRSAGEKIAELTPDLDAADAASAARGETGSLVPARDAVNGRINSYLKNRAVNTAADLQPIANFLNRDALTNLRLAPDQPAPALRALKRGLNEDYIGKWSLEQPAAQKGAARQAYGLLNDELHDLSPETRDIDQRISSLIPVRLQGERVASQAPMAQRVMGRVGAHTGALVGSTLGAGAGYHEGGLRGALVGGLSGLLIPEAIASPEGQMAAARTLNVAPTIVRPFEGGALQVQRLLKRGQTTETGDRSQ